MTEQSCRLCGNKAILQESHILPRFIFRWMKDSSATGFLRSAHNPNRRMQDGKKRYWLCRNCESLFCQWETQFARNLFHPLIKNSRLRVHYEDWMLKFCVSVSWRVLSMFVEDSQLEHFNVRQQAAVPLALKKWSEYMLGNTSNPGIYEQHFLPLDGVASFSGGNLPSNINRYFLRTVDLDILASDKDAIVYSKFANFILMGFIDVILPKRWGGTKVHVQNGHIGKEFILPKYFMNYIFTKCRRMAESKEQISENQQALITASIRKDIDRVIDSNSFIALQSDIELFGVDEAFRSVKPNHDS